MLKSGIINGKEVIEVEDSEILPFLKNLLNQSEEDQTNFKIYNEWVFMDPELKLIGYYVDMKGFVIVHEKTVHYREDLEEGIIDKIDYVQNGYTLEKKQKKEIKNNRVFHYVNPIAAEIERIGFRHSESPENDLSFWYPRTKDTGFYCPETVIIPFTDEEANYIRREQLSKLDEDNIKSRIIEAAKEVPKLDLSQKMFLRLGDFSNKFNFETCCLNSIDELFVKLKKFLYETYYRLEWQNYITLALREFITAKYDRACIYNGMPLNTEFRVFYDFDTKSVLGIYNYWDRNTMLDNLRNEEDLLTFANTTKEIESDFTRLSDKLSSDVTELMPTADLHGRWSIDFMYDGEKFILIDMAHAECSYYYEKVLERERRK